MEIASRSYFLASINWEIIVLVTHNSSFSPFLDFLLKKYADIFIKVFIFSAFIRFLYFFFKNSEAPLSPKSNFVFELFFRIFFEVICLYTYHFPDFELPHLTYSESSTNYRTTFIMIF